MKRTPALILLILTPWAALPQEAPRDFSVPRTIIKLSPIQFFTNTFELGIESFNSSFSKSFQLSAAVRSGAFEYDQGRGYTVELAYRKYASPMKFYSSKNREYYQGVYYSLFINGSQFEGNGSDFIFDSAIQQYVDRPYREEVSSVSPGFTLGLQRTLWKVLVLDIYLGGGLRFVDIQRSPYPMESPYYSITDPAYEGIYPKVGAKIGIGL